MLNKKYEVRNMKYKMNMAISLLAVALFVLILPSCKTEKDTYVTEFNYDYYPIDSGHYVAYQVDSIRYLDQFDRDTASYQIMEVIGDTFYDNENQLSRKINVYRRPNSNSAWALQKVWHVKQTTTNVQKIEDDLRFIKLVFPQSNNTTWNGNIYIPETEPFKIYQNWEYGYSNVHQPYTVNSFSFDSTVIVTEIEVLDNVIERTVSKAVYAKGVGMIYREWDNMTKTPNYINWETEANGGFRIRMKLIDHN